MVCIYEGDVMEDKISSRIAPRDHSERGGP